MVGTAIMEVLVGVGLAGYFGYQMAWLAAVMAWEAYTGQIWRR